MFPRATTSCWRAILLPGSDAPYTVVVVVMAGAVWTSVEVASTVVVSRAVLVDVDAVVVVDSVNSTVVVATVAVVDVVTVIVPTALTTAVMVLVWVLYLT